MKSKNSPEYDLATTMSRLLIPADDQQNIQDQKVQTALEYLNKAAEILDVMNASGAAEVVTLVMERVTREQTLLKRK